MPKNGLVRLPDHVATSLLQALASIRVAFDARLVLQHPDYGRMPSHDRQTDYNVLWRSRPIGRVWRYEYPNHPWTGLGPWHWYWRGVKGKPDTTGHAPTLEAAMADYRRAWDSIAESGVA